MIIRILIKFNYSFSFQSNQNTLFLQKKLKQIFRYQIYIYWICSFYNCNLYEIKPNKFRFVIWFGFFNIEVILLPIQCFWRYEFWQAQDVNSVDIQLFNIGQKNLRCICVSKSKNNWRTKKILTSRELCSTTVILYHMFMKVS